MANNEDTYPHDHDFAVNGSTLELINRHTDAADLDAKTGQKTLVSFNSTNLGCSTLQTQLENQGGMEPRLAIMQT